MCKTWSSQSCICNYGRKIEKQNVLLSYLVLLVFYHYFLNLISLQYMNIPPWTFILRKWRANIFLHQSWWHIIILAWQQKWLLLSELLVLWTVISGVNFPGVSPSQIVCHSMQNWNVMMLKGTFNRRSNNGYVVCCLWGLILEWQSKRAISLLLSCSRCGGGRIWLTMTPKFLLESIILKQIGFWGDKCIALVMVDWHHDSLK